MGQGVRSLRVSAQMRETLPELIAQKVRDPRVAKAGLMCINHVELNRDLSVAYVYVSFIAGDESLHQKAVDILCAVAPALQGAMGRKLGMKRAAELRFKIDPGPEMHQRLAEIRNDTKAKGDS